MTQRKNGLSDSSSDVCARILTSIGLILLTWRLRLYDKAEYRFHHLFTHIRTGWVLLLVQAGLLAMVLLGIQEFQAPSAGAILFALLANLAIGLFEEVLMRDLILKKLLATWCDQKHGVIKSVFFSSIIFGSIHIVNILGNPSLIISTSVQILYATFAGIFFAVLYLKTQRMWTVVLMHGITDFIGALGNLLSKTTTSSLDISLSKGILELVIMAPLAIWGIHQLDKKPPISSRT